MVRSGTIVFPEVKRDLIVDAIIRLPDGLSEGLAQVIIGCGAENFSVARLTNEQAYKIMEYLARNNAVKLNNPLPKPYEVQW